MKPFLSFQTELKEAAKIYLAINRGFATHILFIMRFTTLVTYNFTFVVSACDYLPIYVRRQMNFAYSFNGKKVLRCPVAVSTYTISPFIRLVFLIYN